MQTGYRYAAMNGYDIAVQVDGDGQHLPCEVEKIVNHLKENDLDMVVGSRFLEQGNYKQSIDRLFGIILLRCILYLLTGGKVITDCTSGFRAVNINVIHAFSQWYPEDYPEPEVIFLLLRSSFKVDEVPVKMTHRKSGKTSIPLINGLFYIIKVATALILDMFRDPWHNSSYDH